MFLEVVGKKCEYRWTGLTLASLASATSKSPSARPSLEIYRFSPLQIQGKQLDIQVVTFFTCSRQPASHPTENLWLCYSKHGQRTRSISTTWTLTKNTSLQAPLQTTPILCPHLTHPTCFAWLHTGDICSSFKNHHVTYHLLTLPGSWLLY